MRQPSLVREETDSDLTETILCVQTLFIIRMGSYCLLIPGDVIANCEAVKQSLRAAGKYLIHDRLGSYCLAIPGQCPCESRSG
jgi:hypothetical protein